MARHKESDTKDAIRALLCEACKDIGRTGLTYLGMPAEMAADVKVLRSVLANVICIGKSEESLRETERSIAALRLMQRRFHAIDMWEYLRSRYDAEPLIADVTFLDFYGGGLSRENPFANEIQGLRAYFAKQARHENRAFVFAWTYNPRDRGKGRYVDALAKQKLSTDEIALLENTSGVHARSVAIRLLLRQILSEHDFKVRMYHHALYKGVMNTLIIVFARGADPACSIALADPEELLAAPYYKYRPGHAVPEIARLID